MTFDPPAVERADLLIGDGRIVKKGRGVRSTADTVDLHGAIVVPGLVNAHARLGLDPFRGLGASPDTDREASLARAHTEESVIWSAFVGAIESLRTGTTTLLDLHASPAFASGAISRLREVLLTVGLRSMLAYRVTEDGGQEAVEAARSAAAYGGNEQVRMAVGVGDLETLSEETLSTLSQIVERYEVPVHAELCRDTAAADACRKAFKKGPLERLEKAGLIGAQTVLAGAGLLDDAERERVAQAGATIASGGDSSDGARRPVDAVGTGTGGTDLFGALSGTWDADDALASIVAGHRLASRVFGLPIGTFEEGAAADLLVLDYIPSLPLNAATVAQHVVHGMASRHVASVMVQGRFVVRDRQLTDLDVENLYRNVQRGALDLYAAWAGTDFPGWTPEQAQEESEDEPEEDAAGVTFAAAPDDEPADEPEHSPDEEPDDDLQPEEEDEAPEEPEPEASEADDEADDEADADEEEDDDARRREADEPEATTSDDPFGAGVF